jgi:hypothetical protein
MESVNGCIPLLFPRRRKFGDDEVQPHVRQHMVLRYALAFGIHDSEVELRAS